MINPKHYEPVFYISPQGKISWQARRESFGRTHILNRQDIQALIERTKANETISDRQANGTDHANVPENTIETIDELETNHAITTKGSLSLEHYADQFITLNLRFPGQYYDEESGTHYNHHRDYDPSTGRYLQKDPLGLEAGINVYAYVEGNPILYLDSNGEIPILVWAIGGAMIYCAYRVYTYTLEETIIDSDCDDKIKHCIASCRVNRCFSWLFFPTVNLGIGKEVADGIKGMITGNGSSYSNYDMQANLIGILKSYITFDCKRSCEQSIVKSSCCVPYD